MNEKNPPERPNGSFDRSGKTTRTIRKRPGPSLVNPPEAASGPADKVDRALATETLDKNVVVLAGAGTGKTFLLVRRWLTLVLGQGIAADRVLTLTFTEKAAQEMRSRITAELDRVASANSREDAPGVAASFLLEEIRQAYRLSRSAVEDRAREALQKLEKAIIGTIHSFAAHVLRLYPLEAGVDPQAEVDEGEGFERVFAECWPQWLEEELDLPSSQFDSSRAKAWFRVLEEVRLEDLEDLARELCTYRIPLSSFRERFSELRPKLESKPPGEPQGSFETGALRRGSAGASPSNSRESGTEPYLDPALPFWKDLAMLCRELSERYPAQKNAAERAARAYAESFAALCQKGTDSLADSAALGEPELAGNLDEKGIRPSASKPAAWSRTDFQSLRRVVRLVDQILTARSDTVKDCLSVLLPFAEQFREVWYPQRSLVSFDGLLAFTRDLLAKRPDVRGDVKRSFDALLIDELQDTDPVQVEIVFYVAERLDSSAPDHTQVRLEPGKLFVVGDPKQSIYGFRWADVGAFQWVRERIAAEQGLELELQTNFRSRKALIDFTNGLFAPLIRERPGLQPAYRPIKPARIEGPGVHPELWLVEGAQEPLRAREARRVEAAAIAKWIVENHGRPGPADKDGQPRALEHRDIAVLLRGLGELGIYLEAFRAEGIPYTVEGEKSFYATQEILDLVNLLRVVHSPKDTVALVGLLRSPLGGVTDREIYELGRKNLLDTRLGASKALEAMPHVRSLYALLGELHEKSFRLNVPDLLTEIFERCFVLETALLSFASEQAMANLLKFQRLAERSAAAASVFLGDFLPGVLGRIQRAAEEGESPLADETFDAVRVLSVHRAKGLEFPVVFLADLHRRPPPAAPQTTRTTWDWSSGLFGIRVGKLSDWQTALLEYKERLREEEEERRIFYVAVTRARDRLVLSGSAGYESASPLAEMDSALGVRLNELGKVARVGAGEGVLRVKRIAATPPPPRPSRRPPPPARGRIGWHDFARKWRERAERCRAVSASRLFQAPTDAIAGRDSRAEPRDVAPAGDRAPTVQHGSAKHLGTLCHRVLEKIDFTRAQKELHRQIEQTIAGWAETETLSPQQKEELAEEVRDALEKFFRSPAFEEIRQAEILGREVPFVFAEPGSGTVLRGAMDLLYRSGNEIIVADYKTDAISPEGIEARMVHYAPQAEAYRRAVESALGATSVTFKFVWVRLGLMSTLGTGSPALRARSRASRE